MTKASNGNKGRTRPPAKSSGRYVEGWRDRFCVLCDFGPAVALGNHYRRRHGIAYQSLGLTKEDVNSPERLAALQDIASDIGHVVDRVGYAYSPTPAVRRRSNDRRRRWAVAAREEVLRGPGYRARLARRWRVSQEEASSRLYLLRKAGLIPSRGPATCGTPAGYQRHWRAGEAPCDACREALRAYRREWWAENNEVNRASSRQRRARRAEDINARRRELRAGRRDEENARRRQRYAARRQEAKQ